MRKQKRSVDQIFASGGIIDTGNSNSNYWNNTPTDPKPITAPSYTHNTALDGAVQNPPKDNSNTSGINVASLVSTGGGLINAGIDAIDTGKHTGGRQSVGAQTGKAAVTGATLGYTVGGGYGALIGAVLGAGYGLIKGVGQEHGAMRKQRSIATREKSFYSDNTLQTNLDPYGNTYEDGGLTDGSPGAQAMQQPQQDQRRLINVEKGEIMVNPMDMTVVQEFLNPNRFSKHQSNTYKEPSGNFVALPEGHVIIPKKLANRFKQGDILSRKSIVMQLLSDQATDPYHNVPDEQKPAGAPTYEAGGMVMDGPGPKRRKQGKVTYSNYGTSGIIKDGKMIDNPTETEALINMAHYMQNNKSDQSDDPSNVYRNEFQHFSFEPKAIVPVAENGMLVGPGPRDARRKKFNFMATDLPGFVGPVQPDYMTDGTKFGTNSIGRSFMQKTSITNPGTEQMAAPDGEPIDNNNPSPANNPAPATPNKKGRININKGVRTLLQTLPIAAQLGNNGEDPYLSPNPNVQYNTALSYANQLPEDISVAGNLAANDRSFALAAKGIDNNDTPSARAEKGQLLAEKLAGDNAVYTGKENAGVQLKSTKLQALLGLSKEQGADWQQDNRYLSTELRMDAAARDNNRAAGLVNLSENLLQGQNDDERVKALNAITHTIDIDPFAQDIVKEDPGFVPFIYNYIFSGKGDYVAAKNEYLSGRRDKDKTTSYDKTVTDKKGNQTTTTGTKREKTN